MACVLGYHAPNWNMVFQSPLEPLSTANLWPVPARSHPSPPVTVWTPLCQESSAGMLPLRRQNQNSRPSQWRALQRQQDAQGLLLQASS